MMNLELFDGTWAARAPVSDASLDASSEAFGAAPAILAAATALPPNVIEQESIATLLKALWGDKYDQSRRWRSKLGAAAAQSALAAAGMTARDVDHLFFVTGTGIATPSLDARIVNRLGMRSDVRRTPIFGLGCAGGVAGIVRAADVLRGFPGQVAMVVSAELCSLTLQRTDDSVANIIASALFGDGAAAVLLGGAHLANRGAGIPPRVIATRSVFYPDSEGMMGWEVVDSGFKIVLSPAIPDLVRAHLGGDVDAMLTEHGLARSAISHWIAHTGGNRVLEAIATALDLPPGALDRSWRLLAATGNLSSASVLFVLRDLLDARAARSGEYGLMLAMGPGFCAELALLRW